MLAGTSQIYLKPKAHSKDTLSLLFVPKTLFRSRSNSNAVLLPLQWTPDFDFRRSRSRASMGFVVVLEPMRTVRFVFSARVNSLYRVRDGTVTQIVKGDPQWPQSFYPLPTPIEIQTDDYLIGQCVYDNDDDQVIRVG